MSEIYENFRNFGEISSNTIMNVYISILTLGLKYMKILEISKCHQTIMNIYISTLTVGLKYMKILEISKKFQRDFEEISSNTIMNVYISILTLGLKYMKILEISEIITSSDTWGRG